MLWNGSRPLQPKHLLERSSNARCTFVSQPVNHTAPTAYSLRHSSIVRALLAGTPARLVASLHDTSIPMLEKTYAAFIADHGDAQARHGLLDTAQPAADPNVVPLRERR